MKSYVVVCRRISTGHITLQFFQTLQEAELCRIRLLEWNDVEIHERMLETADFAIGEI